MKHYHIGCLLKDERSATACVNANSYKEAYTLFMDAIASTWGGELNIVKFLEEEDEAGTLMNYLLNRNQEVIEQGIAALAFYEGDQEIDDVKGHDDHGLIATEVVREAQQIIEHAHKMAQQYQDDPRQEEGE